MTQQTARPPTGVSARRRYGDRILKNGVAGSSWLVIALVVATLAFLLDQVWPSMSHYGPFSAWGSSRWAPSEATSATSPNPYGIGQFLYGTVITSVIAMVIALPVAVAVALYTTEVAPMWLRKPLSALVDLLAAIPSVVYGFWGVFALLPAIKPIGQWLTDNPGHWPIVEPLFRGPYFGVSYFAAGIVLAIMILPIVTALCREVFATAPVAEKEAALALGATRAEMLRLAVLPRSRSGIAGAAILGLGRAMGETIAVTMLIGNSVLHISASLFGQGATMPSVMANEFTEATEPFHLSSLFVVAFWLLIISLIVNAAGRWIIRRAGEGVA